MQLEELRERRKQLEAGLKASIVSWIEGFHTDTGLSITGVYVDIANTNLPFQLYPEQPPTQYGPCRFEVEKVTVKLEDI